MVLAQAALDLTRRLATAVRSIKMYGKGHEQSDADLDGFKAALESALATDGRVEFVLQENAVLVQGVLQPYQDATVAFLTEAMRQRAITSLSFHAGVTADELARTATILAESVKEGEELGKTAAAGLLRVRLNVIRAGAVVRSQTLMGAGMPDTKVVFAGTPRAARPTTSEAVPTLPEGDTKRIARVARAASAALPGEWPPMPGWEAACACQPAGVVGDYFDLFPVGASRVGLVIADAAGMVAVRSAFHRAAPGIESPRAAILQVNRLVVPGLPLEVSIALAYGVFDLATHVLSWVNCARNPPFVYDGKVRRLDPGGVALALSSPDRFEAALVEQRIAISPGMRLVFCTDGVVTATNDAGVEFGEREAMGVIEGNGGKPAKDLAEALLRAVSEHRGAAVQTHDLAVLALRRLVP